MTKGDLQPWVLLMLLLCNRGSALSAPSGLTVSSINLKHTLSWLPLQDKCNTTALYSVQYQGEFERQLKNGSWLAVAGCQLTSLSQCELSTELNSDSDYNLRVRVRCENVLSPWQLLAPPFNRKHTLLREPVLKLVVLGDGLSVSITGVPDICSVRVSLWRNGQENQVQEQVVLSDHGSVDVLFDSAALLDGEEYCVRAQSELPSVVVSRSTAPQCVVITGSSWQTAVTVAFVVLLTVGFLSAVLWFMIHHLPRACLTFFHKEALPHSLEVRNVREPAPLQEVPQEQVHILRVVPEATPPSVALLEDTVPLPWSQADHVH